MGSYHTWGGNKINIIHVVQRYHPNIGGSETVVQELSERLAARGHNVTVLTRDSPSMNLNGVTVKPTKTYRKDIERLTKKADILMVFGQKVWCSDWLPLTKIHCPLVYYPVGFSHWNKTIQHKIYYNLWQKRVCNKADVIVAATQKEYEFLESWLENCTLVKIPFGVDYEYWQKNPERFNPNRESE